MPAAYQTPKWYPLDMAGNIFPVTRSRSWNETCRVGLLLKEEVDPARLRQALAELRPRYPSFFVGVRRGFFWYYLEPMGNTDVVYPEEGYPCRPLDLFSAVKPTLCVLYDRRRLSVEFSHLVADGGGILVFLKALLARYLELGGVELPAGSGLPELTGPPRQGELADSYQEFRTKCGAKPKGHGLAYQYRAPQTKGYLKVIHGQVPLEDILPIVKARGLTVTDYLMAAYIYAFYAADPRARRSRRPIQISVPVSLRKFYPSESLRNFSLFAVLGFEPRAQKNCSFEDVLEAMRGKLAAATTREEMHALLCNSVTLMNAPVFRAIPNVIKRQFMRLGNLFIGEMSNTSPLSNLGRFELPPCLAEHIETIEVLLGGSPHKRIGCVVVSDERLLHIYFSGNTKATDVQREFFQLLAREGIRVRAESNIRGEEGACA